MQGTEGEDGKEVSPKVTMMTVREKRTFSSSYKTRKARFYVKKADRVSGCHLSAHDPLA